MLTEEDVRRIVREELARGAPENMGKEGPYLIVTLLDGKPFTGALGGRVYQHSVRNEKGRLYDYADLADRHPNFEHCRRLRQVAIPLGATIQKFLEQHTPPEES